MYDISAAFTRIIITFKGGTQDQGTARFQQANKVFIDPADFAADGSPLDVGTPDVADARVSLNKELVSWKSKKVIPVTLRLIPNSYSDRLMRNKLYASRSGEGEDVEIAKMEVVYQCESQTFGVDDTVEETMTLVNGRIKSGTFGPNIAAEGKLTGGQYSMVFADVEPQK